MSAILRRALAWVEAQRAAENAPTFRSAAPASVRAAAPPERSDRRGRAKAIAAALCRRFEGCFLRAYLCPASVATIGYGSTHYEDGRRVKLSDPPITRERAESMLLHLIEHEYLPAVLALCPGLANESAERLAAIIDWTFNLGAGNLRASTMRRRINARQWHLVPVEIRKWVRAGGRVLRGLQLRREAEADLI